jgi:hypothetical protein
MSFFETNHPYSQRRKEFVMHIAARSLIAGSSCIALAITAAIAADSPVETNPGKYAVKVTGGLSFAEFKGYEDWSAIAMSENGGMVSVILGNPAMIKAYKEGIPGNGEPFPDGAKMAKVHWKLRKNDTAPGQPTQPGALDNIDFMMKDSKRFADGGGWGYAFFKYDNASDTFSPATLADRPPQANDAKCGVACHTAAKTKDYVFTEYGKR